jgi:lysozyme family protein
MNSLKVVLTPVAWSVGFYPHADGVLGPISLATVAKASVATVIAKLSGMQRAYYRSLPTYSTFGVGWNHRTDARVSAALKLAHGAKP